MRQHRRGGPNGDRISKIVRDSMDSDVVREAGDRIKALISEKPLWSMAIGLAAGFVLGRLIRGRE